MDPLVQRTDFGAPSADQWRHRRSFWHPLAPSLHHVRYRPERVRERAYLEYGTDLARLQRRRVRCGNKYLGLHLGYKFANVRRPPLELVALLPATIAIRRAVIRPEMTDLVQRPQLGVPERAERGQLPPVGKAFLKVRLEFCGGARLQGIDPHFHDHGTSRIGLSDLLLGCNRSPCVPLSNRDVKSAVRNLRTIQQCGRLYESQLAATTVDRPTARGEVNGASVGQATTRLTISLSRGLRYFCIFAGELWGSRIGVSLVVPLDSRFTRPGALELILDLDAENSEALPFQFHDIPVLEGIQATMIGAGRDDVARHQSLHRAQPGDAVLDVGDHLFRIEILFEFAVHRKAYSQVLWVRYLIARDDVWADGSKGLPRFHYKELVRRRRQAARGPIDEVHVSKDVVHRLVDGYVARPLADDHRDLGLPFEHDSRHIRQNHRVARADDCRRCLMKGVSVR